MTSHLEGLDIFLNSKGYLLKDENFDILDSNWNLDDDKFLESIRYGDRLDDLDESDGLMDPDPDSDGTDSPGGFDSPGVGSPGVIQIGGQSPEVISYNLEGSPSSSGSSVSSCSPTHSQHSGSSISNYDENVKVVQLVGILPAGCNTFQIVQQDDDSGEEIMEVTEVSSSSGSGGHHQNYQELKLSDEEKRLLIKEGVKLPTHFPLTKFEERELKRIRRKIRNKISAQDSRKRKKEFLDTLQQRVQEVEEEKSLLGRKVRSLEIANSKLVAQVKRLQVLMASKVASARSTAPQNGVNQNGASAGTAHAQGGQGHNNVVPAATTLLVLMLSLAIVVLPTMQGRRQQSNSLASIESALLKGFADSNPNTSLIGRSRTMLGLDQTTDENDCDWTLDVNEEPMTKIPRFSFYQSAAVGKVHSSAQRSCQGSFQANSGSSAGVGRKRPFSAGVKGLVDEVD